MEEPYIQREVVQIVQEYNPKYGDDRKCQCGHPYYRHFDTYDNMYPCGCKYCPCRTFVEHVEGQIEGYHHDYPTEPIGDGNPYHRCSLCGKSDPEINGRVENHHSWCEYRKGKEGQA